MPFKGVFSAGIPIPCTGTIDDRETSLQGEENKDDRECFLRFMQKLLQWEPEKRSSARELAADEWILKHTTDTQVEVDISRPQKPFDCLKSLSIDD